jgi:hypothetical protein
MAYRYDHTSRQELGELVFEHEFTDFEWAQVIELAENAEVQDGSEWIYSACSVLDLDPEPYLDGKDT